LPKPKSAVCCRAQMVPQQVAAATAMARREVLMNDLRLSHPV
jgi:hypothetical protein